MGVQFALQHTLVKLGDVAVVKSPCGKGVLRIDILKTHNQSGEIVSLWKRFGRFCDVAPSVHDGSDSLNFTAVLIAEDLPAFLYRADADTNRVSVVLSEKRVEFPIRGEGFSSGEGNGYGEFLGIDDLV